MSRKILFNKISLYAYFISILLMSSSMFFLFRSFKLTFVVLSILGAVLTAFFALVLALTADYSISEPSIESQAKIIHDEKLASQETQTTDESTLVQESTPNELVTQESNSVIESATLIKNKEPEINVNETHNEDYLNEAFNHIESSFNEIVDKRPSQSNNLEHNVIQSQTSQQPQEAFVSQIDKPSPVNTEISVKENPYVVKPHGYNEAEQLAKRAKERRSKKEIVQRWKLVNPMGTKRDCASDLGISLKTVKKWWD